MKAFLATVCTLLCTSLATAGITVNGTGKVTYIPDLAYVSVGVSSDGKTAAEAWQKNSALVKKLFEVLKAHGINPKDMQTSGLNVTPRYVHPRNEEARLVGYTVSYDLAVTVRKLGDLGKVLDDLVENGANRRVGIRFGIAHPDTLLDQARARAIADARKKAEIFVKGAGANLGLVQSISEGSFAPYRTYHLDLAKGAASGLTIAAGEQELSVTISVTYAISHVPAPRLCDRVPAGE
jgi:uncharacterized protein YggE